MWRQITATLTPTQPTSKTRSTKHETRNKKQETACLPGLVVLRPVAGAHEFVLRLAPGDNASQVGAHRDDAVVLDRLVLFHHQVGRVPLWNENMKPRGGGGRTKKNGAVGENGSFGTLSMKQKKFQEKARKQQHNDGITSMTIKCTAGHG